MAEYVATPYPHNNLPGEPVYRPLLREADKEAEHMIEQLPRGSKVEVHKIDKAGYHFKRKYISLEEGDDEE